MESPDRDTRNGFMEQGRIHQCQCPECRPSRSTSPTKVLHEHMNVLISTLDERQRRLYAGLESKKVGHGGDRLLSLIIGLNVDTIARGRRELDELPVQGRVRQPGGGRPLLEKKNAGIRAALLAMLQDDTVGDPCSTRKWKRRSLHNLAEQLRPQYTVSAPTVARLLRELDYSPKVNRKHLGESSPDRERQFQYILRQKRLFLGHGWPAVSIDAKKRELVGGFKNAGTAWCNAPFSVNAYDYPSLAEGIGIPYGIYDPARNEGFVSVGVSGNTAEFAVATLLWWWQTYGRRRYSNAPGLLIRADGGGSNSAARISGNTLYKLSSWIVPV